jgi:hypothetical protein
MAQKVLVQLIDDLDGTTAENVETVNFALDGVVYDIDLKAENAAKLRDSVADFVANARRTGGRAKRAASTTDRRAAAQPRNKEQTKAIREWALRTGHQLAGRGRIPAHVIEEFEKAHQ